MGFWSRLSSSVSMLPSVVGVSLVAGDGLGAKEHVGARSGLAGASDEEQTLNGPCWESGFSAGSSWRDILL